MHAFENGVYIQQLKKRYRNSIKLHTKILILRTPRNEGHIKKFFKK